jgi:hypothetical protein
MFTGHRIVPKNCADLTVSRADICSMDLDIPHPGMLSPTTPKPAFLIKVRLFIKSPLQGIMF